MALTLYFTTKVTIIPSSLPGGTTGMNILRKLEWPDDKLGGGSILRESLLSWDSIAIPVEWGWDNRLSQLAQMDHILSTSILSLSLPHTSHAARHIFQIFLGCKQLSSSQDGQLTIVGLFYRWDYNGNDTRVWMISQMVYLKHFAVVRRLTNVIFLLQKMATGSIKNKLYFH